MVCCMVACSKFPREMLSSVNVCMCIVFVFSVWLVLLYSFGFLHNRLILKLIIHQAFRCATGLIRSPANILFRWLLVIADPNVDKCKSLKMNQPQTYRGPSYYVDG